MDGKKFSTIFLSEVVEHLEDDPLHEVFGEISALISKDGVLIVTTPNSETLEESFVYCPNCDVEFHRWQHVRTWSVETLSAFLNSAGFEIVAVLETNFENPPGLKSGLKGVVKRLLSRKVNAHLAIIARAR